ncbi:DoxX family protein [Pseudomarimonas salicorniae]|uniref:DoxX family protein n=1 Tax=Pseudomarimonas salicorniae TaxID=2933270 RepID=A0ABT0GGK0_9GAMM|nr:DoxX family protein [Lysobacter sp. CAU 1642]MCK7593665.1 DoxX family protein [Lysobacter sp. CAU 1642]
MSAPTTIYHAIASRLEGLGEWLAPLGLRLILAWEFWEAGREKFTGSNWFMNIEDQFPFPFNVVPSDLSWAMATWFELIGAVALLIGLATRFFAFSLLVLTIVATAAVHWPSDWQSVADLLMGYAISDKGHGNYKLPLIFFVMLLPLVLTGPGKLSLDALLHRLSGVGSPQAVLDGYAAGGALLALGLPLSMLLPTIGFAMAGAGVLLLGLSWRYSG